MALRTPAFNDAKTYGFEWLRALLEAGLQEGVIAANDFKVTAAAAGGQRVDVAAGTALVKGDSGTPGTGLSQGLYLIVNDASIANALTHNASDATNPRLDQVILRVRDTSDLGSTADDAVLELVTGTATAGATLDNRTGAGALPGDAIRLADVLIPAASTAVVAGNVRDRRPWARGAFTRTLLTTGGNRTTASTTLAAIDATALAARVECSGVPLRVAIQGLFSTGANTTGLGVLVDGVTADALSGGGLVVGVPSSQSTPPAMVIAPAAGTHVIAPAWNNSGGVTNTLIVSTSYPATLVIEELVRQNANNT